MQSQPIEVQLDLPALAALKANNIYQRYTALMNPPFYLDTHSAAQRNRRAFMLQIISRDGDDPFYRQTVIDKHCDIVDGLEKLVSTR